MKKAIRPPTHESPLDPSLQPLLRSLVLELLIYAPLVILYFFLVLRLAGRFLTDLYIQNTTHYAVIALAAIVAQGVLLERLTAWLLHRFGLRK
jgi:hypothetical protein